MKYQEFERVAEEAFDAIPDQYKEGIDALVVSRETVRHPTLPDIFTLGYCDTEAYPSDWSGPETVRSIIRIHYGSFQRLAALDPDFDWEAEIFETVQHEVKHHLEYLAAEDQLGDVDYVLDESFKRAEGLEFDPWYWQRGEPVGHGAYVAEDQVYVEVSLTAAEMEEARAVLFKWRGRSYAFDPPDELGDVHFVWITEGVERPPPWLEVVLVRKRTWWEDVKRLVSSSRNRILESEAVARPAGAGPAPGPPERPVSPGS